MHLYARGGTLTAVHTYLSAQGIPKGHLQKCSTMVKHTCAHSVCSLKGKYTPSGNRYTRRPTHRVALPMSYFAESGQLPTGLVNVVAPVQKGPPSPAEGREVHSDCKGCFLGVKKGNL